MTLLLPLELFQLHPWGRLEHFVYPRYHYLPPWFPFNTLAEIELRARGPHRRVVCCRYYRENYLRDKKSNIDRFEGIRITLNLESRDPIFRQIAPLDSQHCTV